MEINKGETQKALMSIIMIKISPKIALNFQRPCSPSYLQYRERDIISPFLFPYRHLSQSKVIRNLGQHV